MSRVKRSHRSKNSIGSRRSQLNTHIEKMVDDKAKELFEAQLPNTMKLVIEMMMTIPAIVINDNFGKLIPKEGRLDRFMELVYELYQKVESEEVSLEELKSQLEDSLGHKLDWKFL